MRLVVRPFQSPLTPSSLPNRIRPSSMPRYGTTPPLTPRVRCVVSTVITPHSGVVITTLMTPATAPTPKFIMGPMVPPCLRAKGRARG